MIATLDEESNVHKDNASISWLRALRPDRCLGQQGPAAADYQWTARSIL